MTRVIAEAGTCHMGEMDKAISYVHAAMTVGADTIKFQIFSDKPMGSMFCWIEGDEARLPRWEYSWMTPHEWYMVKEYTEACGMTFLASAFEQYTVDMLKDMGVKEYKVASRAAKDFPYEEGNKYLISLGMYSRNKIPWVNHASFMQCEAQYPSTSPWRSHLLEGFSDHSGQPFFAVDAIARGCNTIEVHFHIAPVDAGPDLPASLNLIDLETVCRAKEFYK